MIPPNQAAQQAMLAQRVMAQQAQDPLLAALGKQKMMGEMMSHTADYKMKMYKLKQKYGMQGQGGGGVMQQPAMVPPQPQGPPQQGGM